jgi:hypothetical protein
VAAAPASADSTSATTNPNPFATLSCACHENAPAGSPMLKDEIARGIAEGRQSGQPGHNPGSSCGAAWLNAECA